MLRVLLLGFLVLAGCSDTPPDCQSNDDCREGFRCDDGLFKGECVQRVQVIRCGASFCEYPFQACQDRQCVETGAGGGGGSPTPDAGQGGAGGQGAAGGVGGAGGQGGIGGQGGVGGQGGDVDAGPPPAEPTVLIEAPIPGSVFVDVEPVLTGRVNALHASGEVSLILDDMMPGVPLETDGMGRFSEPLRLPSGPHKATVKVTQGAFSAEASVSFRVAIFVTVSNGQFVQSCQPLRFVALYAPDLISDAHAFLANGASDRVDEVFEKARTLGVTVVRTRAYDDRPNAPERIQSAEGEYNPAGFAALDHVIDRAGAHGIKLILPLVGNSDTYGGVLQYLKWGGFLVPVPTDRRRFFTPGAIREHFKAHVNAMLTHTNGLNQTAYRDDPTILGWEVIDGANQTGVFEGVGGEEIIDFMTDLTQVISANAPRQLVATGDIGFDINPTSYQRDIEPFQMAGLDSLFDGSHGVAWHRNLRLGTVDFATVQLVPADMGFAIGATSYSNLGASWVRAHSRLASLEGKPLVVTLAQMPDNPLTLAERRDVVRAWFDEIQSIEAAGFVLGNFYADDSPRNGDRTGWGLATGTAPEAQGNQYADLIQGFAAELMGAE